MCFQEPEPTVKIFMESKPLMVDFEALFKHYRRMEADIDEFPQSYQVGSIVFFTENLKRGLKTEINNWKLAYAKALNEKSSSDMQMVFDKIDDIQKRLSRPCKDLDDVRTHMGALAEIRQNEIFIDQTITPVEETYAMFNRYEISFNDGKPELVDTLQYSWTKCLQQGKEVQSNLLEIQPAFKQKLSDNVSAFQQDVTNFVSDYSNKFEFLFLVSTTFDFTLSSLFSEVLWSVEFRHEKRAIVLPYSKRDSMNYGENLKPTVPEKIFSVYQLPNILIYNESNESDTFCN